MPNPPPRKRFQIHLSTAIVLMFVAGGMYWMNFRRVAGSKGAKEQGRFCSLLLDSRIDNNDRLVKLLGIGEWQ